MALSREAQQLLAGIAGGLAGAAAGGGQVGAAAAGGAAMDRVGAIDDRRQAASHRQQELALKEAMMVDKARKFNIQTQLELLDTGNLSPASQERLVGHIAQQTGMTPDQIKINMSQGIKMTDLFNIITDENVPDAIKTEAWEENAPRFGFNTEVTSWTEIGESFQDLNPEVKQQIFEELRSGNIQDVHRVSRFLSTFNNGKPITGAQLQALGIQTGTGLTFDQRLEVMRRQQQARLQMSPDQFMRFMGAWIQEQRILGRSTMTPDEFEAEMGVLTEAMGAMQEEIQSLFGPNVNRTTGGTETAGTGSAKQRNLNRMRERIMDNAYNSVDEAIQAYTSEVQGSTITDTDRQLFEKWFREAKQKQQADEEVQ